MSMINDIERVLFSQQELQSKVTELGARITEDYAGKEPIFVGVLKGCFVFMADLMRAPCSTVRSAGLHGKRICLRIRWMRRCIRCGNSTGRRKC